MKLSARNHPKPNSFDEKGYNGWNFICVNISPIRCKITPPNPAKNPFIYHKFVLINDPKIILKIIPDINANMMLWVIVL
jgi:hypothetical protein